MNNAEWETLRRDIAPFLNRLACAADADPRQQEQMHTALLRFQDALYDAYEPGCIVSVRSYLMRNLARFAYALGGALRPETPLCNTGETSLKRGASASPRINADLNERADLRGRDWLEQMERWPNCLSLPEAVTRLASPQREVFVAHYYQGRSFAEIAMRLNLQSSDAVGSLFDTALEQLSVELTRLPLVLK